MFLKVTKNKTMINRQTNLHDIIFVKLLLVLIIASSKCDYMVFKIRKCCPENELISERDSECVENNLLKADNHIYFTEGIEKEKDLKISTDPKNSWPWWFPPSSKILSKRNNDLLMNFPEKYQLFAGKDLPCRGGETSVLPAYYYNFSFFDDGSLILYPDRKNGNHSMKTKIFEPLTFCVDRIELKDDISNEENSDPVLDIPETKDHVVILCPCIQATCILKCCKPGMIFDMRDGMDKNSCIRSSGADWMPVYSKEDEGDSGYFLLERMPNCKPGYSIVIPNYPITNSPGYVIFSNGSARIEGETFISEPMEFCGDNIIDNVDNKIHNHILRCYPKSGVEGEWLLVKRILYGWLSVIGAIFLCMTLVIHYSLPGVRKLHDESLIYQTWCLFIGYTSLAVTQLTSAMLPYKICSFFGFLIQYYFLAAFFWLNTLCFDVWYTFSSLRHQNGCNGQDKQKKSICYLIYGWLTPGVIVIITVLMEYCPGVSEDILKPEISELCWFKKGSLAELVYFYGPIAVLLGINFFLFLHTAFKIMQTRSDISSTITNRNIKSQRFRLYLKLFILMGLSWIMELISWAVGGPEYYWFIPDIVNLSRAVFIFILVCFKKQVFKELKKKISLRKYSSKRSQSNTRNTITPSQCYIEHFKYPNNADSSL